MIDVTLPYFSIEISNTEHSNLDFSRAINEIKFLRESQQKKFNLIILLVVQEKVNNQLLKNSVIPKIKNILEMFEIDNYAYIINSWQEDNDLKDDPNIIFSDTWAIRSFVFFRRENKRFSNIWNYYSNKALFFIGKADRIHRIGLLYKFLKNDQIKDNLLWSLYLNDYYKENLKSFILDNISDQEFKIFLQESIKTLDLKNNSEVNEVNDIIIDHSSINFNSFKFDYTLYKKTIISIVSESEFFPYKGMDMFKGQLVNDPYIQITEKTWKAMINYHPFIGVGRTDYLIKLKELGFKTFEEYMAIPDYSTIEDKNKRLEAVVENVKYFITKIQNRYYLISSIKEDINYNFTYFHQYVQNQYNILSNSLGLTSIDDINYLLKL